MKITGIKQQQKNPERVSIFVDGKFSFSLNIDQLSETKIHLNQEINEAEVSILKKTSEDGKVKSRTLNWLLMRPHSEKELRDYLKNKKVDSELSEQLTQFFISKKIVDDQYFASWWVESRRRSKLASNKKIFSELLGKGIALEVIQSKLGEDKESEKELLVLLIQKKQRQSKYKDNQKLMEYLVRQGYNYYDVKNALAGK